MSAFGKSEIADGAKISGWFDLSSDRKVLGELTVNGPETEVYLHDDNFFSVSPHRRINLNGELIDRRKVTLAECTVVSNMGSATRNGKAFHYATLKPGYVVSGSRYLEMQSPEIFGASFHTDDAEKIFYDFDAFGHVIDARSTIDAVVQANAKHINREIAVGDEPQIAYFAGRRELASVDTAFGRVSVRHKPYANWFPDSTGVWIKNQIVTDIGYTAAETLNETLSKILSILRFFEIIAGRPQNLNWVELHVSGEVRKDYLSLYWCNKPNRSKNWERKPSRVSEMLVDAAEEREAFEGILEKWIARDSDRLSSRVRFSDGFAQQRKFTIDRLVGAANMFDILPDDALPSKVSLADNVKAARDAARKLFRLLPASDERNSILGALGRLGHLTLRQKILHRAHLVSAALPKPLAEIDMIVDEAVKCRNHFVHGTDGSFDYFQHNAMMNFLTKALEFLFATSDFIDAGWNIAAWHDRCGVMFHPFSETVREWDQRASELRALRVSADE